MTTPVQRLQAKHHKIIDLLIEGRSKKAIAEELGLTPMGVINLTNSPVFRHEFARRKEEQRKLTDEADVQRRLTAADILDDSALDAAKTQGELLRSENERIRQTAAMDILDRTGYPKVTKSESRSVTAQIILTADVVERMQRATQDVFKEDLDFAILEEEED